MKNYGKIFIQMAFELSIIVITFNNHN